MCRNITELRGLEPPATQEEIEAAAYQFVRKITGVTKPTGATAEDMRAVSLEIASLATDLLERLPPRRQPPKTVPPLRRPEVRARMGLEPFPVRPARSDDRHAGVPSRLGTRLRQGGVWGADEVTVEVDRRSRTGPRVFRARVEHPAAQQVLDASTVQRCKRGAQAARTHGGPRRVLVVGPTGAQAIRHTVSLGR